MKFLRIDIGKCILTLLLLLKNEVEILCVKFLAINPERVDDISLSAVCHYSIGGSSVL